MVRRAEQYKWSSARAHIKGQDDGLVRVAPLLAYNDDWRSVLRTDPADDFAGRMDYHAASGWPMGDEAFIKKLERKGGQSMKAQPRGRPRKDKE